MTSRLHTVCVCWAAMKGIDIKKNKEDTDSDENNEYMVRWVWDAGLGKA